MIDSKETKPLHVGNKGPATPTGKGEMDLDTLLRDLSATLDPETYVFVTLAPADVPLGINPKMTFLEAEGTTLILALDQADQAGLGYEFPCRCITLQVHSALEAVGFLARITTALAAEGMGVNPVAGYYHDHLFVPENRAEDAMAALARLAGAH